MRDRPTQVIILALLLTLIGGGLAFYKWRYLGFPLLPDSRAQVWTVEASMGFEAGAGSIEAQMFVPGLTPGFAILDENFVSRNFGDSTSLVSGGRQVTFAIRRARGPQSLYYRAVVYKDASRLEDDTTPPFPASPMLAEPFGTAARNLVEDVGRKSANPASFTRELLERLNAPQTDSNIDLLTGPEPSAVDIARTATTLLAEALIPARLVRGVYLQDQQRRADVVPWLMVHDGDNWLYFNPRTGDEGLPGNFLLWWSGTEPLAQVDGGDDLDVRISVSSSLIDPVSLAQQRSEARAGPLGRLSLFALPIQTQAVYAVLLLVPLGALVVVVLRNLVGVQTFGTFMPVLIALAFRETRLIGGLVLFSVLVALALGLRFYLERLRLLAVPRLTAVLIIVVLLMLAVSVVGHQFGVELGLSVALFPMVILAMTVERMSIVWEERGSGEAIQQGLGSLLVAAISFGVMEIELLQHLVFVFPETLLVVLAVTLLLGRYTGYRLTELYRFREFGGGAK